MSGVSSYGRPLEFKKNEPIVFLDFTLIYEGEESGPNDSAGPTVTFIKKTFLIKDKNGLIQKLDVIAGQTPPLPLQFEVNHKSYTLLTYQMPNGDRLYPNRLAVIKN